uniref:Uncharacterized protein n=1 Tax=Anguilla anguilla TaxID=7936 RepID=A0A0E9QXJ4_ANGAN
MCFFRICLTVTLYTLIHCIELLGVTLYFT